MHTKKQSCVKSKNAWPNLKPRSWLKLRRLKHRQGLSKKRKPKLKKSLRKRLSLKRLALQLMSRNASQPKMLVISPENGIGHPLVHQVGGQWVQRISSLWITDYAKWLLKTEKSPVVAARLADYAARDRVMLLEDIGRERPDIILLDMDWEARTRSDPALSALLRAYSEISREQGIIILGRNDREKPRKGSIGSN